MLLLEKMQNSHDSDTRPHALVVSEVRIYRELLAGAICAAKSWTVATASDTADAAACAYALRPSPILIDGGISGGPDCIQKLQEAAPSSLVVVVAGLASDREVAEWMRAGVDVYLTRDCALNDLLEAVGESIASAGAPEGIGALVVNTGSAVPWAHSLTQRELEITSLIAEGRTNKEIAGVLAIQVNTVKNHVHRILQKLGLERRAEVIVLAHREEARQRTEL